MYKKIQPKSFSLVANHKLSRIRFWVIIFLENYQNTAIIIQIQLLQVYLQIIKN
jgi:hypothetical protein